jgi:hypothetical protein
VKPQPRLRRSFRLTIYILCALVGLHAIIWYIIASQLNSNIERWAAERRSEGWVVNHGAVKMDGYPLAWRATVETPQLIRAKREPAFHWSGPAIVLSWEPWKPRLLGFEVTGTHKTGLKSGQNTTHITVAMAQGWGTLRFGPRGVLKQLDLLLDGAKISPRPDQTFHINQLRAMIDSSPTDESKKPPKSHQIPSLRANAELFGLTLPEETRSPLGRTIGRLILQSTVLGRLPPGRPKESLSAWQKDGGTLEIRQLELGWASLVVLAGGTIALDSALQPVGAMTGKVSGHNETLDVLVTANLIKPGAAMVAKFALGALSRTPPGGGRSEIDIPLSIQEGWLFVGPVKLLKMPKIRWH